jgi:aspartyl-tRNA(Asn)/glutamyl-tRNA(Gln) amidotransferase subunit C
MTRPRIGLDEVRHVARLSALALDEDELAQLGPQLVAIVEHVAQLDQVNTEGVEPTAHPSATMAPLREDAVVPSLPREEALQSAPVSAHGAFAVPKVLE